MFFPSDHAAEFKAYLVYSLGNMYVSFLGALFLRFLARDGASLACGAASRVRPTPHRRRSFEPNSVCVVRNMASCSRLRAFSQAHGGSKRPGSALEPGGASHARRALRSSDADPNILADYVVALVRNDKPTAELRKICEDQLGEFLGKGASSASCCDLSRVVSRERARALGPV